MNDWRLVAKHDHLYGRSFSKVTFPFCSISDHEHCEFCWGKFSNEKEDFHIGFCNAKENWWICEACFAEFKSRFKLTIDEETA